MSEQSELPQQVNAEQVIFQEKVTDKIEQVEQQQIGLRQVKLQQIESQQIKSQQERAWCL